MFKAAGRQAAGNKPHEGNGQKASFLHVLIVAKMVVMRDFPQAQCSATGGPRKKVINCSNCCSTARTSSSFDDGFVVRREVTYGGCLSCSSPQ